MPRIAALAVREQHVLFLFISAGYRVAILVQANESTPGDVVYAPAEGRPSEGGSEPESGGQRRYHEGEDPDDPGVRERRLPEVVIVIEGAPG